MLHKLVVVGLAGFVSIAANVAAAQEAGPAASIVNGVSFADPGLNIATDRITLNVRDPAPDRFGAMAPSPGRGRDRADDRAYELSLTARGAAGFDLSLAQRGRVGFDDAGDISRRSRASELRLGRGLQMRDDEPTATPRWYFFAASQDEALIWRPGAGAASEGPGFALQERVEIGDMQAGITYEAFGVQASLAYVEREFSVRSGSRTFSQDERFAGLTITMRR